MPASLVFPLLEWYFTSLNPEWVSWNLGCPSHALCLALG